MRKEIQKEYMSFEESHEELEPLKDCPYEELYEKLIRTRTFKEHGIGSALIMLGVSGLILPGGYKYTQDISQIGFTSAIVHNGYDALRFIEREDSFSPFFSWRHRDNLAPKQILDKILEYSEKITFEDLKIWTYSEDIDGKQDHKLKFPDSLGDFTYGGVTINDLGQIFLAGPNHFYDVKKWTPEDGHIHMRLNTLDTSIFEGLYRETSKFYEEEQNQIPPYKLITG